MSLGELQMTLSYLKFKKYKRKILLKGQVADKKTGEAIPLCQIFVADSVCSLKVIALASPQGKFEIKVPFYSGRSLYIMYVGYNDLELPFNKLK